MKLEENNTKITIGNDCMFSYGISMRTTDGHAIYDINTKQLLNSGRDIIIGNHVWIGYGVTVLKGSVIADNSVVAAKSLVNKIFEENNVIVGGHPAKVIRHNIGWSRKTPYDFIKQQNNI